MKRQRVTHRQIMRMVTNCMYISQSVNMKTLNSEFCLYKDIIIIIIILDDIRTQPEHNIH